MRERLVLERSGVLLDFTNRHDEFPRARYKRSKDRTGDVTVVESDLHGRAGGDGGWDVESGV